MPMGVYPRTYRPLTERFWSHVEKSDGCWLWTPRPANGGYGRIRERGRGRKLKAHRLSWKIHYGPIPEGLGVLHHCDVPACVRPDHLFLGAPADNAADKVAKARQSKGIGTGMAKLTPNTVRLIRRRVAEGATQRQTAREFGISHTAVRWVVIGKTWKHVT